MRCLFFPHLSIPSADNFDLGDRKIRKKFDKENVKLAEEDAKPLPESELKERLKAADELEKSLKADKKNGWTDTKFTEEKLAAAIKKMDERIQVQKLAALDRDEGKRFI